MNNYGYLTALSISLLFATACGNDMQEIARPMLFTSLKQEVVIPELAAQGDFPEWLEGTLVRNGPAQFEIETDVVGHPFDGLAMLHAFSFKGGKIGYANKFLESLYYKNAINNGKLGKGFLQDPCKNIFQKFLSYFMPDSRLDQYDNANVNVAKIADHFVALTETPLPIEFDLQTLKTVGNFTFKDGLKEDITTAHPHSDFQTKESFNYSTQFGRNSFYHIYSLPLDSTSRSLVASVPVDKPSYMHSFAVTKKYIVLVEVPYRVNPLYLLFSQDSFIKNYAWNPDQGTIFTVVNRENGQIVKRIKGEPFFMFHHVNAYDQDNTVVIDLIAYDDTTVIEALSFDHLFGSAQKPVLNQKLKRFTVDLENETIESRCLSDLPIEMPQINYQAYNMQKYRFMYAIEFAASRVPHSLVKIDVTNGSASKWYEEGCCPGEPVFVASPCAKHEDDGVILSVVLNEKTKRSFLLALDAKEFKEIARAELVHHVPFQLHGQFFKAQS